MRALVLFLLVPLITAQYSDCPPGWISLSDSLGCVLFHTDACVEGCGWLEAMEECQRLSSWLLEIGSQEDQIFITNMAKVKLYFLPHKKYLNNFSR